MSEARSGRVPSTHFHFKVPSEEPGAQRWPGAEGHRQASAAPPPGELMDQIIQTRALNTLVKSPNQSHAELPK